ncbi:hypothetical protein JKP88DRAFT_280647 [Tribonema minus]|uniref:Uncharacterized protein n=1 Tax=Tribonema minus TaxID=303371 RepID=A0A835YYU3_9STRA|nr:hypothetical protein JKP88DRAFT_280647 [Tribonema minus]
MASASGRSQAAAAASRSGQEVLEGKLERSEKENTVCNGDETDEDSAEDDASSDLVLAAGLDDVMMDLNAYIRQCYDDHMEWVTIHGEPFGLDKNGNLAVPEGPMIFTDGSSVQIDLAAVASKIRHENLRQLLLQGMLMRALAASPIYPWERFHRKKWEWLPPFPQAQARNYLRSKEYLEACRFSHAWFYEKTSPVLDLEPDPMAALTAAQLAQLGKHYDRYFSSGCGADLLAVWHLRGSKYEVVWSDMHS